MRLIQLKPLLLLPLCWLIIGCQETNQMKKRLIKGNHNSDAFCVYIGYIELPYRLKPINTEANQNRAMKYAMMLQQRLAAFEQAG